MSKLPFEDAVNQRLKDHPMRPSSKPVSLAQYMPRHARYEPRGGMIYAVTDKGHMRLCDIRGFGHYTGHGQAWGLDAETATAVQDRIGEQLARAWNLMDQHKALVDALHESQAFLQNQLDNERGIVGRALLEQQIARNTKAIASIQQGGK